MYKIIETQDGSTTIESDRFSGEEYHSTRGAVGEAMHVYIRFLEDGLSVLEMGFGSGLNALLSLRSGLKLRYTTMELYPVDIEVIGGLSFYCEELESLHSAEWGVWNAINEDFSFRKLRVDVSNISELPDEKFDLVFWDAFAPTAVPEQWSEELFSAIFSRMNRGGRLVTYSSKGDVKRALRGAGFEVRRLEGALGKHNMVLATVPCDD